MPAGGQRSPENRVHNQVTVPVALYTATQSHDVRSTSCSAAHPTGSATSASTSAPARGQARRRQIAVSTGPAPEAANAGSTKTAGAESTSKRTGATGKRTSATGKRQLSQLTKAELYQRATDLDIPHRSTMTRGQLQHTLEHTTRPRRTAS
ncbi:MULTISPECIES: hypothetical protein [unclassified Kitasatospora]|uniref:hypothetical protein n=1 Tax=unclassified Kitasatospora TaxID=2633591 RepID=UPI0034111E38